MIGRELKLQLAKLALEHRVAPVVRAPLPLLPATDRPQIITGCASTVDVDADRMSFQPGSLSWPDDLSTLPLVIGHDLQRVGGRILSLEYRADGKLAIKARVDEGRDMPAFSIAAVVTVAEICNVDSFCFHALIHKAVITHIGLTDRPANERAVITHRRDALSIDHSHDDVVAAIDRLRKSLVVYAGTVTAVPAPAPPASAPPPLRSLGAAPPLILGRLPAAILKQHRTPFRDLVARLPIGG